MTERRRLRAVRPADKRLAFIDFRLRFVGSITRRLLSDEFDISPQQATKDFRKYLEMAPSNVEYSLTGKAYIATESFEPLYRSTSTRTYLRRLGLVATGGTRYRRWVGDEIPAVLTKVRPRVPKDAVLTSVIKAIRSKRELIVTYTSMNSGETSRRRLAPLALVNDGYRWHVRSQDLADDEFKDFVLGRMSRPKIGRSVDVNLAEDEAWSSSCSIVLKPARQKNEKATDAVAQEFGMQDGQLVVHTTKAKLFYMLRGYGFDPRLDDDLGHMRNSSILPLVIGNLKDVEKNLDRKPTR